MNTELVAGDLIIAPPTLTSNPFSGAVIMLAGIDPTFGFVVNKPASTPLKSIAPSLPGNLNAEVFWGGPVNSHTVWILHSKDWRMHNTVDISEYWALTTNINMFSVIADGYVPAHWRIFVGFSTWGPGQLAYEIDNLTQSQGWIIAPNPPAFFVTTEKSKDLWQASIEISKTRAVDSWFNF